jgi:hypothetical protein
MAVKAASNESTVSGAADAGALGDGPVDVDALGDAEAPAHADRTIAAAATAARSVARVFINNSSFMFWLRQTTESTTGGALIASNRPNS